MSSVTVAPAPGATGVLPDKQVSRVRKKLTNPVASLVAVVIGIIWTVPTVGLLVSSIRPRLNQNLTGWWKGLTGPFTTDHYKSLTTGLEGDTSHSLIPYLVNSFVIVIPATIIPITVASLAAYGLIWTKVRGRDWLFIAIFALQIVPLQLAVIPLLNLFTNGWHLGSTTVIPDFGIGGHAAAIWIAHSCFGLPLIIFLLHNFMSEVPGDIVEAARIDGAGHGQIYRQIMLPLLTPAIAAIAIFQFLWVWNDLFVGLIMGGGNPDINPITVKVQGLVSSSSGGGTELLPAAAFLSIIIPLVVFLALQRYFVRGLLAGSVKG
ncbi:MAG TPA: carbohydrate ABC transporter permease [Jatrophihabitantaceae bacterium]